MRFAERKASPSGLHGRDISYPVNVDPEMRLYSDYYADWPTTRRLSRCCGCVLSLVSEWKTLAHVDRYLDRDEVITIRFRIRRGVDWSDRWTLGELRRFHDALRSPFVCAHGHMSWRRGQDVIREPFEVAISCSSRTCTGTQSWH